MFLDKDSYSSKTSCSWVHWFGFLVHHREGYKMTCFSLAPKFKNGTKLSKLDPDEKTSATSQKNFQSLRCSHCTWSCWWDYLTEASFNGKRQEERGKLKVDLLRVLHRQFNNYFLWILWLICTDQRLVRIARLWEA